MSDYTKVTFHRDGTITMWSVYEGVWWSHVRPSDVPDGEIAAMGMRPEVRDKVIALKEAEKEYYEID